MDNQQKPQPPPAKKLRVGIIGAGLGGLTAAIAIARAGAHVTILEATSELGEIGAGIQMLPNVSRFLVRWGVDGLIGSNLVPFKECTTRWGPDATLIERADVSTVVRNAGFPWWVVRRDHLHAGLVESAVREHGVKLVTGARVARIVDDQDETEEVTVFTEGDAASYTFDLVVGADGIRSATRAHLFPGITPRATSKVAAYRGVLSYSAVYAAVPEARGFLGQGCDVWTGPRGYILTYPISGGRELNIVTAFCKDDYVTAPAPVDIDEFRAYYKDYHPVVQKMLRLVAYTQRWPLLSMPRLETWSNASQNVVLMGDAAHCMQNHMAQGAATAMEDGAFLGRVLSEVVRGTLTVREAVRIYEKQRIPKAWTKQQMSLMSGLNNMREEPEGVRAREEASRPQVERLARNPVTPAEMPPTYRSWQIWDSDVAVPGVFYYDAEADADCAVLEYLQSSGEVDEFEMLSERVRAKFGGHVLDNGMGHAVGLLGGAANGEMADVPKHGAVAVDAYKRVATAAVSA